MPGGIGWARWGGREATVLCGAFGLIWTTVFLPGRAIDWLIPEERPIESLGSIGLFLSGVLLVLIWRSQHADPASPRVLRLSTVALALVFFGGAGEEVSWGQRVFGYGTPESLEHMNAQAEFNVHNLSWFTGSLDADRLFQFFWLILGVLIPLAALNPSARAVLRRIILVLPATMAIPLMLNQAFILAARHVFGDHPSWYHSHRWSSAYASVEIKESLIAVTFAVGFWLLWRWQVRDRRSQLESATDPRREPEQAARRTLVRWPTGAQHSRHARPRAADPVAAPRQRQRPRTPPTRPATNISPRHSGGGGI